MLAAKILINQEIKVFPVCFESYFFGASQAARSAEYIGLKLETVSFAEEHLDIVKKPVYRYGKGMNPCIDCHLLMLKKAGEIIRNGNYDFVATGEVLDERPFSQNERVMSFMEKEANLEGLVLRPLSAKLLKEAIPEKNGLVDRKKLYDIRGKSRKEHIKLAEKLGVEKFPQPAGGCLLTDPEYSKKLKELFKRAPNFSGADCEILKKGRVIWDGEILFIVGRNEKENETLEKCKTENSAIIIPENFPGPSVLVKSYSKKLQPGIIEKAKELVLKYSKKTTTEPKHIVNI